MAIKTVLLCAVNSQYIHSNPAVWSLKKAAETYESQYNVQLPELQIREYTINEAYDRVLCDILSRNPDVLCFSVYIWNVARIRALLADLRLVLPETTIVLGGPEVSFGNIAIPDTLYDVVLTGEGERKFFTFLLSRLNIPVPAEFQTERLLSGAEIPFIYTEENLSLFENRIVYYESTRGCPFSCAYCLSGKRDPVREKPLGQVFEELQFLIDHQVPQVKFVDRTFNCIPDRCEAILQYLLDHAGNSKMNFHFECAGDLFTDRQIERIGKAPKGLFQFEIGIQSTCEETLKLACRKTSIGKVFDRVQKLMALGNCNVHVDLIAGLPGEDYNRFRQSFNEVYALKAHQLQLGFLKILKGAPLEKMQDAYGYVFSQNPPYEILQNAILSNREILEMKGIEDVLNRYYNSGRYPKTLDYLIALCESPWDFYKGLASWFQKKGLLGQGISAKNASEELLAYGVSVFPDWEEAIGWCLLEDFYGVDPSDVVPVSLRKYHILSARTRKMVEKCPSGVTVRALKDKLYFVDYGAKDLVTGRFSLELIEL
ncbi:MAG: DUF4080 domain-containing protein [Clostridia bacterium]|nr:DUF4080 domain-containing protein [Clostridia bacterium]